ncbi:FAD-binding oxidoreductase [Marinirhabdus gelatinilytica]|uniref:FAD/FMN-containing dehydrogenase n=1 Tax=Marinirhabdus gelatinilytica TaxID=1703343 RepID=A0A370QJI9_9FLAO|nr:FAD-binding oxidoreductase [Marinirhabdus gelatinilytica]RDK88511.1 FAD/FMN-containing dehydrogenase [Marinirhabdus gelatinilytica]
MKIEKTISNWGNFPKLKASEYLFENLHKTQGILEAEESVLARGNGRCYGDAALNNAVVSTLSLKHFLSFDETEGTLTCEAGVLFSDILNLVVPKGFFLPVTPGTKFITVGGAIAADVHGKNHHKDGCFSEFVTQLKLVIDTGETIICSRTENTTLFWETIGGMGLTGIIVEATFQLKRIANSYIYVESIKAKNLTEIMALFEASEDWTYTVAWIDCLQKGKHIGRSILMRGEHARPEQLSNKQQKEPFKLSPTKAIKIPFNFPRFVLNTLSVKAFNWLYYNKQTPKTIKKVTHFEPFFYPLDSLLEWNRIYGKSGFIQYQFVIPKGVGKEALQDILQTIAKSNQGSFLAVLKLFGKNNPKAYNSFPIEGYTLALDFKVNKKLYKLVPELDAIVLKYKGRIYRAKDSLSNARLLDYVKVHNTKFNSVQNRRINKATP